MATTKKKYLQRELTQKDQVINQMVGDPEVKIHEDGTVWILRTQRPSSGDPRTDGEGFRECTICNGTRRVVYYKGYMLSVPRIIYRAFVGPLSTDFEVVHLDGDSRNNRVQNLGTATESGGAGRSLRRFTEEKVVVIRNRRATGEQLKALAQEYGTSSIVISKITRGETYREIGGPRTQNVRNAVPRGADSYRSKLTPQEYMEILKARAQGTSLALLSERYPLTKSGISRLCTREKDQIAALRPTEIK